MCGPRTPYARYTRQRSPPFPRPDPSLAHPCCSDKPGGVLFVLHFPYKGEDEDEKEA